jgi:PAS domain S-box-containing protein
MPGPSSLRKSLSVNFALAAVLPVAAVSTLLLVYLFRTTAENISEKNMLLARAVAGQTESFLREPMAILLDLSQDLSRNRFVADGAIDDLLDTGVSSSTMFESIYLLGKDGRIRNVGFRHGIADPGSQLVGIDLAHTPVVRAVVSTGSPAWSESFHSVASGKVTVSLCIPVGDRIVMGNFNVGSLVTFLKKISKGEHVIPFIVDRNGSIIAYPDEEVSARMVKVIHLPPVRAALAGSEGTYEFLYDGKDLIGSAAVIPGPAWVAVVSQTREDAYRQVHTAGYILTAVGGGTVLLALLLTLYTARRMSAPFSRFARNVGQITEGNYEIHTELNPAFREVEELANHFDRMAVAIRDREQDLRKTREMMELAATEGELGLWEWDIPTDTFTIGSNFPLLLGYTPGEFRPSLESWVKVAHPEDVPKMMEQIVAHLKRVTPVLRMEVRCQARDGAWKWFLVRGKVVDRNPEGLALRAVGICVDITGRKAAEAALLEAKRDWEETFDAINEAITIHDGNFRILRANRAASEILGHPFLSTEEPKCHEVYHGLMDPPSACASCEVLRTGRATVKEIFEPHLGKHIEVKAFPRLDPEGKIVGVVHIVRDVTDIVKANEAQKKLQEQFLHAQKMEAVGRLAGGVAHDFNNILTAIQGYGELLYSRLPSADPSREYVAEIIKSADRAASLTRQLLTFSRRQVLQPQVLDINGIVSDSVRMIRRLITEDIELYTVLARVPGRIKADPGQIEQILMNLSVNARDAMPKGGRLTIETGNTAFDTPHAEGAEIIPPGPYSTLLVSDTGVGMDPSTIEHIFEPFFTTKDTGRGTGLGLSTVYGIVRQSGGYVTVSSEPGRGATFRIYFPRVETNEEPAREPGVSEGIPAGSETVLLVEDEGAIRRLMAKILRENGYTVLEGSDGQGALEVSGRQQGPIHLLVTDVVMPGMSGRELAVRLVRSRPEMRVIYMSGYTDDEISRHGVLVPGVIFIQKPFSPSFLARKIRQVLDA